MSNRYNSIEQQVDFVKSTIKEHPLAVLAIATYTAEEFAEALCRAGVPANNIAFVEIDSVGYYRFIAERNMELGEASRSAYAAWPHNNTSVE